VRMERNEVLANIMRHERTATKRSDGKRRKWKVLTFPLLVLYFGKGGVMLIKCSKCGKTKTNTQFSRQKYPGKTPRSKFNGWCKQCRIADSKKYYKEKGYTRSLNPLTRRFQYITAYLNHAGSTLKTTDIKELYAKQKGLCAHRYSDDSWRTW
jgi:hypothetical protein